MPTKHWVSQQEETGANEQNLHIVWEYISDLGIGRLHRN